MKLVKLNQGSAYGGRTMVAAGNCCCCCNCCCNFSIGDILDIFD